MTIIEYINRATIPALLDDDKVRLKGLVEAAKLCIGSACPECSGKNVNITCNDGTEGYCEDCQEAVNPAEAAVRKLQDLGYDIYLG